MANDGKNGCQMAKFFFSKDVKKFIKKEDDVQMFKLFGYKYIDI